MFNLEKNREECERLRDVVEASGSEDLPPILRRHLADCSACQAMVEDVSASRRLLRQMRVPAAEPGPWFAPRVMAAIAARESELLSAQETWMMLPKLAARMTWISALALILAGTWLYETPRTAQRSGNENGVETLFDGATSAAPQDDVLVNSERGR